MRKITEEMALAFQQGRSKTKVNTYVEVYQVDDVDRVAMYLHGNCIASMLGGELLLTLAGWPTSTTKERLNGLLQTLGRPERFWQRDYQQYFGTTDGHRTIDDNEWVRVDLLRYGV